MTASTGEGSKAKAPVHLITEQANQSRNSLLLNSGLASQLLAVAVRESRCCRTATAVEEADA